MSRWWQASEQELLAALSQSQRKINAAHRDNLELIAEIKRRGAGVAAGFRSEIELLHLTQNITKTAARARLDAAADVLPGRTVSGEPLTPELPETAAAVAEDAISLEHVTAVRVVLASLPPHLERERPVLEAQLAGWARTFDAALVRRLGKAALEFLDPDGPEPRDDSPARTRLSMAADGAGYSLAGWLDREAHATLMSALSPLAAPRPAADGTPDPRTAAERQGAGLVELARRMLDTGNLPGEGGQKPHLVVTVPLPVLESGQGTALLDFGDGTLAGAIAAEDARRLACDAHRSHIWLDAESLPLDAGRTTYVVPRHIRRALHQRDHGCAFPGCTIPPQWTDAHHIVHWADGGSTALCNLVLLCPMHHVLLHSSEWTVTITDGLPVFHPPPWQQSPPRTNPLHRPDRILLRDRRRAWSAAAG
jgi:hypothetical protein